MSYDVLVIGGGPAGLSAAVNVRARGRRVLVVSNPLEENPLWRAEKVDNYLGLPGLSGAEMLAALLTTTLTVAKPSVDGGGSETVQDKVFLLSMAEVGLGAENGVTEGAKLAMFSDNASRQCKPTAQAVSNSEYTNSGLSASQFWYWWLLSLIHI